MTGFARLLALASNSPKASWPDRRAESSSSRMTELAPTNMFGSPTTLAGSTAMRSFGNASSPTKRATFS